MRDESYITATTAIYDKRLRVIAGVEGAGKSSAAGIWRHYDKEILESTLTEDEIACIRQKKEQGYYIELAYIGLESLDEHLSRIQNRVRKGGPSAEPEAVSAQYDHRWEALNKVLPLCDEAAFYDNKNGFRCVGRCCSHVMEISQKSCRWFQEFLASSFWDMGYAKSPTEDNKTDLIASYIPGNHKRVLEAFGMWQAANTRLYTPLPKNHNNTGSWSVKGTGA